MTILIPDVHGRSFWHEALPYIEKGVRTIFLGDYLDAYHFEDIDDVEAIDNFREILSVAERHRNVELLLGNHDCGYMFDPMVCDCRTDYVNYDEISDLFLGHKRLFKLCTTVGDGEPLFVSHAGINRIWIEKWADTLFEDGVIDYSTLCCRINKTICDEGLYLPLCDVSIYRGGDNKAGSIVWADVDEFDQAQAFIPFDQIVGHTLQAFFMYNEYGEKVVHSDVAVTKSDGEHQLFCIDTRECYMLDDNMVLSPLLVIPDKKQQGG